MHSIECFRPCRQRACTDGEIFLSGERSQVVATENPILQECEEKIASMFLRQGNVEQGGVKDEHDIHNSGGAPVAAGSDSQDAELDLRAFTDLMRRCRRSMRRASAPEELPVDALARTCSGAREHAASLLARTGGPEPAQSVAAAAMPVDPLSRTLPRNFSSGMRTATAVAPFHVVAVPRVEPQRTVAAGAAVGGSVGDPLVRTIAHPPALVSTFVEPAPRFAADSVTKRHYAPVTVHRMIAHHTPCAVRRGVHTGISTHDMLHCSSVVRPRVAWPLR